MDEKEIYDKIVNSDSFQKEKKFMQHGTTTVYDHSLYVMETSFKIAKKALVAIPKKPDKIAYLFLTSLLFTSL